MASRTERDYHKGLRALEDMDFRRAAKIGTKLIERDCAEGYEIRARALYAMGDADEPVRLLDIATKKYPDVLVNWSLIGEMYSNSKRFEDALASFQQFKISGGDTRVADFNIALVYGRQGRLELALKAIEGAFGGEMPDHMVLSTKASYLIQSGRFEEALRYSEEAVALEETAYGLATVAQSQHGLDRKEEATKTARAALDLDMTNPSALDVLRRSNPRPTKESKLYQVTISGQLTNKKAKGFETTYYCIADSPEETLEYYQTLAPETTDLSVKKYSVAQESTEGNKGVVAIMS